MARILAPPVSNGREFFAALTRGVAVVSSPVMTSPAEVPTRALYQRVLDAWNRRSATDFAACFAEDGSIVGFDGSPVDGRDEIGAHLSPIFANHPTAAYVAVVREVREIAPGVALLRAAVGMVPPGQADINPAVNSMQTMVASAHGNEWRIVMLHTTPAAFHGRPEATEALSAELRARLRA